MLFSQCTSYASPWLSDGRLMFRGAKLVPGNMLLSAPQSMQYILARGVLFVSTLLLPFFGSDFGSLQFWNSSPSAL